MDTVFVSYARKRQESVTQLCADIELLGRSAWFDKDLAGGSIWWDKILEHIRACDVFVYALSEESRESAACQLEHAYAASLGKPVLPVVIADGLEVQLLPASLAGVQFVDYRRFDKAAMGELSRALNTLPRAAALPDPLPPAPPAPISYLGSLSEQIDSPLPLGFDAQTGLFTRLKQAMQDRIEPELVDRLLLKLRQRHDLYAQVAKDLDLLMNTRAAPTPSPPSKPPPVVDKHAANVTRRRAAAMLAVGIVASAAMLWIQSIRLTSANRVGAAPAGVTPPVAPPATVEHVVVFQFQDEQQAESAERRMRSKGYPGSVRPDPSMPASYVVRLGPYKNTEHADATRQAVEAATGYVGHLE